MGRFNFIETNINDLYLIETMKFEDHRGYFMENYNEKDFKEAGLNMKFVQDNQSKSKHGVLRGLHYQKNYPQGKLVRVIEGEIFDVAVDLRDNSTTYGKWFGAILSKENNRQLYIPEGFCHGFLVLSDYADFLYKCSNHYHPEDECGLLWNDPAINIDWPLDLVAEVVLSHKDKLWGGLEQNI